MTNKKINDFKFFTKAGSKDLKTKFTLDLSLQIYKGSKELTTEARLLSHHDFAREYRAIVDIEGVEINPGGEIVRLDF